MMVKDESRVIERCLKSVRQHIDCWLIADTGSKDDTIARIEAELEGIPGEIIELAFVSFSKTRNQLRQLAAGRADYVLWLDADEVIECPPEGLAELQD